MIEIKQGDVDIEAISKLVKLHDQLGIGKLVLNEKINCGQGGRKRHGFARQRRPLQALVLYKLRGSNVLNEHLHKINMS